MLQNPCKTFGFKKKYGLQNSPWGGGGKPYPASGLYSKFPNGGPPFPRNMWFFYNKITMYYIVISLVLKGRFGPRRSNAVLLLRIFYGFLSVLCLLCLCVRLFICALWSPAGKGLTSWLSFVVSHCEFVTLPLVSWDRCGTWLYRFLIFEPLLTLITFFKLITAFRQFLWI